MSERIIDRRTDLSVHCNHCGPIRKLAGSSFFGRGPGDTWEPCAACSEEMNRLALPSLDKQICEDCGAEGFHTCPHQKILESIADGQLAHTTELPMRKLEREFWERVALQMFSNGVWACRTPDPLPPSGPVYQEMDRERAAVIIREIGAQSDALTAEWRSRFAKERADGQ